MHIISVNMPSQTITSTYPHLRSSLVYVPRATSFRNLMPLFKIFLPVNSDPTCCILPTLIYSSLLLALCYISASSHHHHQHHHHPHSRNGMNGSSLHQTGHRHKALGAAIGTTEATARHGWSATFAAGDETGNKRVPGWASFLSVEHKLHLPR